MGSISLFGVVVPVDRLIATASALALTGILYLILRRLRVGRAIVAVRLDRDAATLMGSMSIRSMRLHLVSARRWLVVPAC
jgi:branched-chain amino acid transport system permease protein